MTDSDGPHDDVETTALGFPLEPIGDAVVQLDVDAETYERLHAAYCHAVGCGGYPDTFETFVMNYTTADYRITVEGEPVDPDPDAVDVDGIDSDTDSHTAQRR